MRKLLRGDRRFWADDLEEIHNDREYASSVIDTPRPSSLDDKDMSYRQRSRTGQGEEIEMDKHIV